VICDVRMRHADAALFCHGGKWPLIAQHPMPRRGILRPSQTVTRASRRAQFLTYLQRGSQPSWISRHELGNT
jgi:hypothetical protein